MIIYNNLWRKANLWDIYSARQNTTIGYEHIPINAGYSQYLHIGLRQTIPIKIKVFKILYYFLI